ncbi:hypothetical protein [Leptolyngbya sp. ST-U4]|uniref:hypothetical protein n=1 Tax=Leptolyngbya sp. ST-U4 TaxID=2933912 RepID=UPI0032985E56
MKHLTYLLLWLSVLTFGHAAHATEANFLTATPAIATSATETPVAATPATILPTNGGDAPIGAQDSPSQNLPSPPPAVILSEAIPAEAIPTEATFTDGSTPADRPLQEKPAHKDNGGGIAFDTFDSPFKPAPTAAAPTPTAPVSPATPAATLTAAPALNALFAGNENSLVAKAVGSAEGTRTPDGSRNPAYYGHTDPGNGVWNLGSFSYQHAATSPEDADAKQLARLRKQADQILQKASDKGLALTLSEKLNGIDLANQAPLAALGQQGYVDWLAVAKSEGQPEADAVLSARVRSFINPQTQRWDAPGLGNNEVRITQDQARRMQAIDRAILANQQQIAQMTPANSGEDQLFSQQSESPFTGVAPTVENKAIAEAPNTDGILNLNL